MRELMPKGEDLRRAVKWVSMRIQEAPGEPLHRLLDEAVFQFDLSPKDAEHLILFFKKRAEAPATDDETE